MSQKQRAAALLCGVLLVAGLVARPLVADQAGKLGGTVRDTEGNPLMGATVFVIGPLFLSGTPASQTITRLITDASGKFLIGDLAPGWYSLRVYSPTRLPVARNRIRVAAGETAEEKFVLGDVFAPLQMKNPAAKLSTWGDDWKWILRTSASTRPILRYRKETESAENNPPQPLPPAQRLIGLIPVSSRGDSTGGDATMGSVLAYLRPLSADSDLLVAGSMTADGMQASTLATAFRRNLKSNPQEITLTVHQLTFGEAGALAGNNGKEPAARAQAMELSYAHSKRVTDAMTVTAGFQTEYLAATVSALTTQPFVTMEMRLSPKNALSFQYGAVRPPSGGDLADRVGELNASPRITLNDYRLRMEQLSHSEISYEHKFSKDTRVKVAAYRDNLKNAAVWGRANGQGLRQLNLAGDFLPNASANGVTLNAGNFSSSGMRVTVVRSWGSNVRTTFAFSNGETLAIASSDTIGSLDTDGVLRDFLRTRATQSFAAGITAKVPTSHTRVTASYEWLPRGRVTDMDPSIDAGADIQPFLNVQIRQPLPSIEFLPARIEAVADFHNLLAQGYVPLASSDDRLVLTPAYRSFRGGFSVQF